MAASVSEKPEWMHKTTTAIMKRPIQLRNRGCKEHQRTFCYMALGYQQISAWDCAPPSSRSRPQRRLPFLRSSTSSCRRAGSARAVSEQIRDTDRMNKGVHPRKEHLDFSAHGSRQRRRDSAGQKEPTGGPDRSHVRLLGRGDDVEEERCARLRSKDTWTCAEGGGGPALRC
jgi:hypothetical protein